MDQNMEGQNPAAAPTESTTPSKDALNLAVLCPCTWFFHEFSWAADYMADEERWGCLCGTSRTRGPEFSDYTFDCLCCRRDFEFCLHRICNNCGGVDSRYCFFHFSGGSGVERAAVPISGISAAD